MNLLYVEDEPDIRELTSLSLQLDPAFEVRTAPSGASALDMLVEDQFTPDVFLLDVMMPEMDGPTTLGRIRALPQFADTPIIFCTARAMEEDNRQLMKLGALGVITKPFNPMTLAKAVRTLIEEPDDLGVKLSNS